MYLCCFSGCGIFYSNDERKKKKAKRAKQNRAVSYNIIFYVKSKYVRVCVCVCHVVMSLFVFFFLFFLGFMCVSDCRELFKRNKNKWTIKIRNTVCGFLFGPGGFCFSPGEDIYVYKEEETVVLDKIK
jgi:hypothetical protein